MGTQMHSTSSVMPNRATSELDRDLRYSEPIASIAPLTGGLQRFQRGRSAPSRWLEIHWVGLRQGLQPSFTLSGEHSGFLKTLPAHHTHQTE